jgi:hypothetical protein
VASEARSEGRRLVPIVLGLAMVATVVAAGLAPNTGVVLAQSGCAYGKCPAPAAFPVWAVTTSVAVVIVALLLALLLLRRRRKKPGTPTETPAPTWSEEGAEPESPYEPEGGQ